MTKTLSSIQKLSSQTQRSCDVICIQQPSADANGQTTTEPSQQIKRSPTGGLEIIHATTGRVRIRATDSRDNLMLDKIGQYLRQQDGVKEVLANQQTGSLVVEFDANMLSLPEMLAIIQQFGVHFQASSQSASNVDPFAAWKSLDFWKEQGISLIPLMIGLAVTGRLGISGLAAFPVYFITANATRHVIDYLELGKDEERGTREQKEKRTETDNKKYSTEKKQAKEISPTPPHTPIPYKIVHAIKGRIRFNVPRIAQDRAYAKRLERLLKTDTQVINVRMNCSAASIAISYEPQETPVSHWVDLIQLADNTIPQTISIKTTEELQPNPITQSTETQQPHLETSSSALANFKYPALFMTLAFMAHIQ
jgi:hypothetical protein